MALYASLCMGGVDSQEKNREESPTCMFKAHNTSGHRHISMKYRRILSLKPPPEEKQRIGVRVKAPQLEGVLGA
jgi:hypothetical protein